LNQDIFVVASEWSQIVAPTKYRHITKRAIAYLHQIDSPYDVPLQERACENEEPEDVGINTVQNDKDWKSKVTCPDCQAIVIEFGEFDDRWLKNDS
jgi:hypothetical protein